MHNYDRQFTAIRRSRRRLGAFLLMATADGARQCNVIKPFIYATAYSCEITLSGCW